MVNSKGACITAYSPPFARGAKVFPAQMSGFITGVVSAGITAPYIGSAAVTKEKIGANAVRTEKISAGAVTTVKIASANVTKEKIGANAVRTEKISAGAVTSAKIRAAFLSGTLVSGQITKAIAHGLGVKPKMVVVTPLLSLAQATSATHISVVLAAASAATTTNFYIIGNQPSNGAVKYVAYVQL